MSLARSGLIVRAATIMSAFPLTSSPIIPFHDRCALPLRYKHSSGDDITSTCNNRHFSFIVHQKDFHTDIIKISDSFRLTL